MAIPGSRKKEKPRPAPMPELASIPTQTGTSRPNALSKSTTEDDVDSDAADVAAGYDDKDLEDVTGESYSAAPLDSFLCVKRRWRGDGYQKYLPWS